MILRMIGLFVMFLVFIGASFFWNGCAPDNELSQKKAENLIINVMMQECILDIPRYAKFIGKPEYEDLRKENICTITLDVIDLQLVSETEAEATYRAGFNGNGRTIRKLLEAWEKMEERLLNIEPRLIPHPEGGFVHYYIDSYDNGTFISVPGDPDGLKGSVQWRELESFKQSVALLLENDTVYSDTLHADFYNNNDGWKVFLGDTYYY